MPEKLPQLDMQDAIIQMAFTGMFGPPSTVVTDLVMVWMKIAITQGDPVNISLEKMKKTSLAAVEIAFNSDLAKELHRRSVAELMQTEGTA